MTLKAYNSTLKSAVVLVSGGLDSTTVLAYALSRGYSCHALTFDYGQRHRVELRAARRVCRALGAVSHRVVKVDLRPIGGSALTADIDVPKGRSAKRMARDIPVTYVPARNTIFLSYALALAEVIKAQDIFIGVNAVDYSGYPDCRPQFIKAFERVAKLGTKAGVDGAGLKIHTPLIELSKAQIVRLGAKLGVDFSLTHSCYDPIESRACGRCDSCLLRRRGFEEASIADPTRYAS
ncbi:MAG: 7-cyano-7-deazaguanine synthase QueC [Planctomycetes bacterium]|jgi:7-cyano-7-deazaguanine synthase|nr:7-cyano-7-deazaguanine synthase QueC [Planctomycetota bacterium]